MYKSLYFIYNRPWKFRPFNAWQRGRKRGAWMLDEHHKKVITVRPLWLFHPLVTWVNCQRTLLPPLFFLSCFIETMHHHDSNKYFLSIRVAVPLFVLLEPSARNSCNCIIHLIPFCYRIFEARPPMALPHAH